MTEQGLERLHKAVTGHTPGPWATSQDAVPDGYTQITVYAESDGERVATVFRNEADARLIEAAPELLDALEAICASVVFPPCEKCNSQLAVDGPTLGDAHDAIKLSRGES